MRLRGGETVGAGGEPRKPTGSNIEVVGGSGGNLLFAGGKECDSGGRVGEDSGEVDKSPVARAPKKRTFNECVAEAGRIDIVWPASSGYSMRTIEKYLLVS